MEGNTYAAASKEPWATTATFFSDLVRCETRLYNALNDRLRSSHGIAASQFEFLRYLRDHPGARVGDLAGFFAIGVGATSKGMDRLEERGWVRRVPNPADRRSSLLELTDAGIELVNDAEGAFAAISELIQAAIEPEELQTMAQALRRLRTALEHDRVGMPVG
ncbi:MarR family winged helix-turn-helix transcriptional regulator [Streptomyces sp. CA-181903]|uniref:MarR family winged helix-turn-helix transcriptional regulator n=1 Tax=Streptomyces sp. CA-181903 TaxID=3240055 RepID=UPI003D92EE23